MLMTTRSIFPNQSSIVYSVNQLLHMNFVEQLQLVEEIVTEISEPLQHIYNLLFLTGRGGSKISVKGAGNHGECGSASLYGGLGAMPPVGSRGKAPSQGVSWRFFVIRSTHSRRILWPHLQSCHLQILLLSHLTITINFYT